MVLPGQFLERATLIPCGDLVLEGLWHRGENLPAMLICPPHPLQGLSMDSPVCAELAFACSRRGHATLRFNYRGAGASQGALTGDLQRCVDDAAAALAVLAESVGSRELAVAGYDFGAAVALELAKRVGDLESVVLVAPKAEGYDFAGLASLSAQGLILVGEHDKSVDRLALANLCQQMGDQLEVIEEADHVFSRGLTQLGQAVGRFIGDADGPMPAERKNEDDWL
ncbi:MAG: alpha/beta fold hydrolase [Myxococcales bacterium]